MVSLDDYRSLMADRPEKLTAEDSHYRDSMGRQRCGNCLHFFQRKIDDYGVCEVVRPDDPEEVELDKVCDFWTVDGKRFPLLKEQE